MPTPLETEEQLRLWLLYRLGRRFDFTVWQADGQVSGEIRDRSAPGLAWQAPGCGSIAECVQRLWRLSLA
jgi:hypothetical protein